MGPQEIYITHVIDEVNKKHYSLGVFSNLSRLKEAIREIYAQHKTRMIVNIEKVNVDIPFFKQEVRLDKFVVTRKGIELQNKKRKGEPTSFAISTRELKTLCRPF